MKTLTIKAEFNRENPSREEYENMLKKLDEVKAWIDEKTAKDNLSTVLNSTLTPLSVKQFLQENKITAINRDWVVMSPDHMPTEGNVISFSTEENDIEPIVYEIDEGFYDLYGEGICSYKEYTEINKIDVNTAEAIFDLFDESFNKNGEFQPKKITMQQLEKDENVLKNIYSTCSEVCEAEFADYLYNNMDEIFEQPHNIALITKAIQDFRSWGADEDEKEIFATINYIQDVEITNIKWDSDGEELSSSLKIEIPMSIFDEEDKEVYDQVVSNYMSDLITDRTGYCHKGFSDTFDENMYFINEYHDYMYADGKYVQADVRVGVEKDENLILDKGIFYADNARTAYLKK